MDIYTLNQVYSISTHPFKSILLLPFSKSLQASVNNIHYFGPILCTFQIVS